MSLLDAHLHGRTVPVAPAVGPVEGPVDRVLPTTLADLAVGEEAEILGYDERLEGAIARRFFDLGFVVGARVRTVRRAPLRDPIVFEVADYEIALRGAQASAIRVRRLG